LGNTALHNDFKFLNSSSSNKDHKLSCSSLIF